MSNTTLVLNHNSELHRESYEHLMDDIADRRSESFVLPLISEENEGGVIKNIDKAAKTGLTKKLSVSSRQGGRLLPGNSSTEGKGEKENFYREELGSLQLSVKQVYEDEFVNAMIGNIAEDLNSPVGLMSTERSSRTLNTDYLNTVDQWAMDIFLGVNRYIDHTDSSVSINQTPTHIFKVDTTNINSFLDLREAMTSGIGFHTETATGASGTYTAIDKLRKPFIAPTDIVKQADHNYVLYLPTNVVTDLKKSTAFNETMRVGDTRGGYNKAINGYVGVIHGIEIRELPLAQGFVDVTDKNWTCLDMDVTSAGMRLKDKTGLWTGQKGHNPRDIKVSRGFLVCKSALAYCVDRVPQYTFKNDPMTKTREGLLDVWMDMKKIRYDTDTELLPNGVKGMDYGVLTVDFVAP